MPCIPATARAMRHSNSVQGGGLPVGVASSPARVSVISHSAASISANRGRTYDELFIGKLRATYGNRDPSETSRCEYPNSPLGLPRERRRACRFSAFNCDLPSRPPQPTKEPSMSLAKPLTLSLACALILATSAAPTFAEVSLSYSSI